MAGTGRGVILSRESAVARMNSKVRDLYKRFLLVGRDYPVGLPRVREKVKAAFFENRHLTDPLAIKKAIKRGRWIVREMIGVVQLKKYRTLNRRYTSDDLRDALRDIENRRLSETTAMQNNNKHGNKDSKHGIPDSKHDKKDSGAR